MNLAASRIYIPIILCCCFVLFFISNLFSISYSIEAPITRQSIEDAPFDWIDVDKQTATAKGDPATDIVEVTYFTKDGILNSTIWLIFPFKELPVGYSMLDYGMLIDSDFDEHTGPNGIDYQLEIRWDNETNTWARVLTEWSTYAVGGRILNETKNFTGFSGDHLFYVSIPIELGDILHPNKFRTVYYAESKKEPGPLITDFTKWISVPPPEIKLTTNPESVKLRQGETKPIELLINSSSYAQPEITIYSKNESSRPLLGFNTNNLTIPSNGFASVPVTINTSSDTEVGPYTVPIYANSTFPSIEFLKSNTSSSQGLQIPLEIKGEDRITESSLLVDVEGPLSLTDQISEFWNKLGQPLSFLYGFLAGSSPVLYRTIKKRLRK
jgi:hypothetical protein